MLKRNRLLCLVLPLTFISPSTIKPFHNQAMQVTEKQVDNIEMVHSNFEIFEEQYKKDKAESNRIEVEQQRQEELKRIEEQKQINKDLICYYNPNDITEPSGISVQKAYDLLEGTTYQTYDVAKSFVDAEKLNPSINVVFLISLTKLESLHGKSNISRNLNNITSWRASRGTWKSFDSKASCIYQTSELISDKYLNPKGEYYSNTDVWSIGKNYCEETNWAKNINIIANEIRNK
jgi:beta-N-acetylglucosaminidase